MPLQRDPGHLASHARRVSRLRLQRWLNLPNQTGLLLFAQRIEEALFDYTLDSYKVPALNTHTRARELLSAIEEVEAGHLSPGALRSIAEELAQSLQRDSVASELIGPGSFEMQRESWWEVKHTDKLRQQANVIRGALWHRAYEQGLRARLHRILPEGRRKEEILRLASDLIVEWMQLGYSRHFIYHLTRSYFFGIRRDPIPPYALVEFFSFFDEPAGKFDVMFRATRDWLDVPRTILPPNVAIHPSAPPVRTSSRLERDFLSSSNREPFVEVRALEAKDARAASDWAFSFVSTVGGVFGLHRHHADYSCSRDSVVYASDMATVLRPASSALLREEECSDSALASELQKTILTLAGDADREGTASRLTAALRLHATAMKSEEATVQLSTLWSAIETLLPSTGEEARIAGIAQRAVPVLSRRYPLKLLRDLHESLLQGYPAEYEAAMSQVPGIAQLQRSASLVILNEYQAQRDVVFAALDKNPLLRFRLFHLNKLFQTPESILKSIEVHEIRVWAHIERIYRSRNLFVHAGRALPYRETLAENLHSYFHTLIRGVVSALRSHPPATDLDAAFYRLRIEHDAHMHALRSAGTRALSPETLAPAVIGPYGSWNAA